MKSCAAINVCWAFASREVNAQSKFSLMPRLFYSGQFLTDEESVLG